MHMQRMGHRPILCINQFIVEIDANVDAHAHADVTCEQGLTAQTSFKTVPVKRKY